MRERDRRKLDSLVRTRAVCAEHPELFDSVKDYEKTLAELDVMIAKLRAHMAAQDAGLASAREGVRTRESARDTLKGTVKSIGRFAATLGVAGLAEKFHLRSELTDHALVARARTVAVDAAPLAEALTGRGLPAAALADLPRQTDALEQAIAATRTNRETHVGARVGIRETLKAATLIVKQLDAIVLHGPRDETTLAAWAMARRIGPRTAAEPETATEPAPTTVTPKTDRAA